MRRVLAALAVAGLLAGCATGAPPPDLDVVADGADGAVPADGAVTDGTWADAAAFVAAAAAQDRPSVVNVFASWCAPCREELPLLLEASREHDEVAWLGIASQDPPRDRAVGFVQDQGIGWPVLYDPAASVHIALQGRVMPVTAFFDATGTLVHVAQGELDTDELAARLAEVGAS